MKRISFLIILIFITGIMFSCNKSSSSDSDEGYIDPGNWSGITVNANKEYSLTPFGATCGPSANCLAIIYLGELDNTDYVGIAVKDVSGTPNFKIYWQATEIPIGTNNISSYTATFNGTSTPGVNLSLTITNTGDGTYHIIFNSPVAGTPTIDTPNYIDALKI